MLNFSSFINSNFWAGYRGGPNEKINEVLESDSCSLEKLMNEQEFIQELKYNNKKLLDYLDHEQISKLLDYIVIMPEEDSHERGHKFPFTAAEVFGAECPSILDKFFELPQKKQPLKNIQFNQNNSSDDDQPEMGENESNDGKNMNQDTKMEETKNQDQEIN